MYKILFLIIIFFLAHLPNIARPLWTSPVGAAACSSEVWRNPWYWHHEDEDDGDKDHDQDYCEDEDNDAVGADED